MENKNLLLNKLVKYLSLEQIVESMDEETRNNFLTDLISISEEVSSKYGFHSYEKKFDSYNPTLKTIYCESTELFHDFDSGIDESYTSYSEVKFHELENSIIEEAKNIELSDEESSIDEGSLEGNLQALFNMYKPIKNGEKIKKRAVK